MEIVYQLMMGLSLAACAGFRAWLPLFVMGVMARTNHIALNPSMQFLASDAMLIIFGLASALEFFGDKFIVVDHFLDAVGTVARPVAGTILASSVLTHIDAQTALLLGLIVGGGTALTMHTGKAVVRAKSTLLAGFHGGTGSTVLSFGEDILSGGISILAFVAPFLAFFFSIVMVVTSAAMIVLGYHAWQQLFRLKTKKPETANLTMENA